MRRRTCAVHAQASWPRRAGGGSVSRMAKKDLAPDLRALYFPGSREPELVVVPALQFAMVDGAGAPDTSNAFQEAIGALYGVAYTMHFAAKKAEIGDVPVLPLEGLFWTGTGERFAAADREGWRWTLMLMESASVTKSLFNESVRQLREKKDPPALSKVRLERWREGCAAQILHVGPYAAETPTIERLHAFIKDQGYRLSGKHHEIYLGDPRRSAPEKLKTVIRQPCSR